MSQDRPLDPQKLELIGRFLQEVGAPDLFAYLQLAPPPGSAEQREAALQKRRAWAQGQQSNPKFRAEALWVIKNVALLREVLLEQPGAYLDHLQQQREGSALETLTLYIRGALADKVLTARAEAAILRQGRELGLSDPAVQRQIEALLLEQGARRTPKGLASAPTITIERREVEAQLRPVPAPPTHDTGPSLTPPDGPDDSSSGVSSRTPPHPHDVPRPPQGLRSLQPGLPTPTSTAAPVLDIEGPEERQLVVGREAVELALVVRNTGQGRMGGQVNTDRAWIQPHPNRLEPDKAEQIIRLVVDPRGLPRRRRSTAKVTVSTRGGGKRSILVQVRRRSPLPLLLAGAFALAGLTSALVYFAMLQAAQAPPPASRLIINVDPPTGELYIDDTLVNTLGSANLSDGFPTDAPFTVRIRAEGFEPWSQQVTVPAGETLVLKPELNLTDAMGYLPPDDAVEGTLAQAVVDAEIAKRASGFNRCFERHIQGQPPGTRIEVAVRGYADRMGEVRGLQFPPRERPDPPLEQCLRRQFRALSLPILDVPADYASFEHLLRYTVPAAP